MYSFLVDNNEHKNSKSVNKNVAETISHNEYQGVLLNKKCVTHWMNRIRSKDIKIETYEIKKKLFSCFDNKIYIQNNG